MPVGSKAAVCSWFSDCRAMLAKLQDMWPRKRRDRRALRRSPVSAFSTPLLDTHDNIENDEDERRDEKYMDDFSRDTKH